MKAGPGLSQDKLLNSVWEYYRPQMAVLSLHYYTRNRLNYTSATEFGEDLWLDYLKRTLYMEDLIKGHSAIMDKYDPEKKVGLIIDEWEHGLKWNRVPLKDFYFSKIHCETTLLPVHVEGKKYTFENDSIPSLSVSASQDKEGKIHISY